jgi:hypothetical protein
MEDPDNKPLATDTYVASSPTRDHGPSKADVLVIGETRNITLAEHETSFWAAVHQWPTAVFWSFFFCIAVVMAGFDAQIITSFFALPAFQQKFGHPYKGSYILSAEWQMALNMVGRWSGYKLRCASQLTVISREILSGRCSAPWPAAGRWKSSVDA